MKWNKLFSFFLFGVLIVSSSPLLSIPTAPDLTHLPSLLAQPGQPGSSLFVPPAAARDYWPTEEWRPRTLQEAGIDPAAIQQMETYAFTRTAPDEQHSGIRTDGVVIIKDGYLVYERYAGGFTPEMRHLIWSCSKSVTNALFGIAVKQGLLRIEEPASRYYPALDQPGKREITIDQLLRMSSGLYTNETYETSPLKSTVNAMLFSSGHLDMAAYAAGQPVIAPPDTRWEYSSLTPNLLMAVLSKTMDQAAYADYPWTMLFDPLGIHSAVFERDAAGTFVGSSYLYLTPRDFARFGYLFLNDGVWDGQRLLPEGWVRYSTTVTPALRTTRLSMQDRYSSSYGAFWWLNRAVPEWNIFKTFPDAPEDLFYADGHWGQSLFIIPSLDMIITVTGDTRDGSFDANHFLKLILDGVKPEAGS